jgi:serine/threonine-protein kinase
MTPERWKKLDALFHESLEFQGEARAAHLARVCGDDEQLRAEAERLVAAHEREGSFIDSPIFVGTAGLTDDDCNESPVGRRIGHYQVISLLGRGGMGEVFLAEDTRLERKVALKILPAAFTENPDRVRRFEHEAKAASSLNHPNILTIHEIGEADGAHYIVSEFVEGETLRERMRREPLSLSVALDVAQQVADALAAAHAAGITHRDIKPENVMARPDGLVKVLDFGLAKLPGMPNAEAGLLAQTPQGIPHSTFRIPHSTSPGLVVGTAHYMSPEQARGQNVDYRTDIFSLGVMLYEMLAGRRPFDGATTSDVMAAILTKEPEPIEELISEAGPKIAQAVIRCLAKEREGRFQTVGELAAQLQAATGRSEQSAPREARRRSRPVWIAATLLLLMIAVVVYWKLAPKGAPNPQIRSLAVLPLENLSGDPAQEYIADGMTDALIGDLSMIGALRVISRTSAMRYKGAKKSLPQIASELGVDAVVEGSVQRFGDRVSVRAQLVHAATERHLWGARYERDLGDVLWLQSEVAQAIAREIRTKITHAERTRLANKHAVNRKALDDYLKGQYHRNKITEDHLLTAIEYFQSAISVDPSYAPAYAGLAECYGLLGSGTVGALPPQEARRRAEEAAGKALEYDPELVEARIVMGYVKMYDWDWAAAEQEFKRAIELNPNNANAHTYYSRYLTSIGRVDEAVAEMDRAQELDPLSLAISAQRGFVLEMARRYDDVIEGLSRVIAQDPNHYQAHMILGRAYAAKGRREEAISTLERATVLSKRSSGALGFLGMAYGLAGRKDEARKILHELLKQNRRGYVSPVAVANVYTGLGARDQAFDWLEKAYQERSYYLAYLKVSPASDPLRTDPRFDDMLRRIGAPR